ITGETADPGIAIAKAFKFTNTEIRPTKTTITDTEKETDRFSAAVEQAKQDIEQIRQLTEQRLGAQKAEIFEAHIFLLMDPDLIDITIDKISDEKINAEYALHEVASLVIGMLQEMDNEMLRERAADVKDVTGRVIAYATAKPYATLTRISEETIIVSNDLTPSDTAQLDLNYISGFITEIGSRTSHSAIMARSLELPAVVGTESLLNRVENGATIIMDATEGRIIIDPTNEELSQYEEKKRQYEERRAQLKLLAEQPSVSADGVHVELAANIGSVEDVAKVLENGADGIGLFRTEFIYMGRKNFPTEEEQVQIYKHVLSKLEGKRV